MPCLSASLLRTYIGDADKGNSHFARTMYFMKVYFIFAEYSRTFYSPRAATRMYFERGAKSVNEIMVTGQHLVMKNSIHLKPGSSTAQIY
jgi:hypothetical protein